MWQGWGFQSFQVTRNFAIIPSLLPLMHFLFCSKKPEVESFRSTGRLSKSNKNWPRSENFCVIVSEVVRRGKRTQPGSTAAGQPGKNRSTGCSLNWKKAKQLPCPGRLPESFLCVMNCNTIFSKRSSIDVRFWKPSPVSSARRGAPGAQVWFMRVSDVIPSLCSGRKAIIF